MSLLIFVFELKKAGVFDCVAVFCSALQCVAVRESVCVCRMSSRVSQHKYITSMYTNTHTRTNT